MTDPKVKPPPERQAKPKSGAVAADLSRRTLLYGSVAGLVLGAGERTALAGSHKLHVLLATDLSPRTLQKYLDGALGAVDVTVYGRVGDFTRGLKAQPGSALSIPEALEAQGLVPKLHGVRAGKSEEEYVLVGVGKKPNPKTVSSVGAVDLFGRRRLVQFVRGLLGAKPSVASVTKLADVLPLLQLGAAESALISKAAYDRLRRRTSLKLHATALGARVGRPAVASSSREVLSRISELPDTINQRLEVDTWK